MSKAMKCDRCGCCFDPTDSEDVEFVHFRNPIFQNAENLRKGSVGRLMMNNALYDDMVDLCPACTRDFERFMQCKMPADAAGRIEGLEAALNKSRETEEKLLNEITFLRTEMLNTTNSTLVNYGQELKQKQFSPNSVPCGGDFDGDGFSRIKPPNG